MARSYGQIMSAIWNDPEFRALTGSAQRAYLMLVTQADISSAGTIALTLKRWSGYAIDTPSDALSDALSELVGKRFLVIDEDTEEVLVRKFVKWDGGWTNAKRRPAITAAANAATSPGIRAALAVELDALDVPHAITDALSDSPSDKASDTPRVVVTEVSTDHNPSTQPATLEPGRKDAASAQKRGTRLPEDWKPTEKDRAWTLERLTQADAATELEKFRNHWHAKPGKDATKLDWNATWRNWVLNSRGSGTRASPQNDTDAHFERAARRMGVAQ